MGGRVAEELVFGRNKVTAGAASDIEQATKIARYMVTQWGMSDELGPVGYAENQQEIFLGHSVTQSKNVSEATARKIDQEMRRIIDAGYNHATELLSANRPLLDALSQGLLEHETLTGEEIGFILRGEPMPTARKVEEPSSSTPSSGKRGSVPTTRPAGDAGGIEPSPQPGA